MTNPLLIMTHVSNNIKTVLVEVGEFQDYRYRKTGDRRAWKKSAEGQYPRNDLKKAKRMEEKNVYCPL